MRILLQLAPLVQTISYPATRMPPVEILQRPPGASLLARRTRLVPSSITHVSRSRRHQALHEAVVVGERQLDLARLRLALDGLDLDSPNPDPLACCLVTPPATRLPSRRDSRTCRPDPGCRRSTQPIAPCTRSVTAARFASGERILRQPAHRRATRDGNGQRNHDPTQQRKPIAHVGRRQHPKPCSTIWIAPDIAGENAAVHAARGPPPTVTLRPAAPQSSIEAYPNGPGIVNGVSTDIDCLKFPLLCCNRNLSGFGDVFLSPCGDG